MWVIRLLVVALFVVAAPACASVGSGPGGPSEEGAAGPTLELHATCETTECDQYYWSCKATVNACFSDCYSMSPDYVVQCLDVCDGYVCGSCPYEGHECSDNAYEYEFDLVSPRDEAVFAACLRAHDWQAACYPGSSLDDCDRQARVRNSTSIDMYDCLAATPCGQSTEHCFGPPSTMGTQFCAQLAEPCDFDASWCSNAWMRALDGTGPYYGKGVVDAFLACTREPGCKNIDRCAYAWHSAVATAE